MHEDVDLMRLPERARQILRPFVDRVLGELGPRLRMAAAYGSLARGEWAPGHDLNTLLVVEAADDLAPLAAILPPARRLGIAPFLLSRGELAAAADVYSVKLDDIAHHHVLLGGVDLLTGLELDREHLRFVCELELRNAALRLRQRRLVLGTARRKPLVFALRHAVPPLRAMLRLKGLPEPRSTPAMLGAAARHLGQPADALAQLWALREPERPASDDTIAALSAALESLLALAIARVDGMHRPIGAPLG